jgi:hypothetical protein
VARSIDRGVAHLRILQRANGDWPHTEMGATALAGLTLLECGATPDDKAVSRAADFVRRASLRTIHTYSICLAILFLDRLGDPGDVPLIESLAVRLLAGQTAQGGWTYYCPPVSEAEMRRLTTVLQERNELVGRRELPRPGGGKRTVRDLPPAILAQLEAVRTPPPAPGGNALPEAHILSQGDNSNTQFGILGLWVMRRYGLPIENALARLDQRFRGTQNDDGGWGYVIGMRRPAGGPDPGLMMPGFGSSAAMTAAGVLGLAVAHGYVAEEGRTEALRDRARELDKDPALARGLAALSTAVDNPTGGRDVPQAGGKSYYFLWSLERVCVALDLQTLDKKDWYGWGAEILLGNQQADGGWHGLYAECGADTCFALLFLKRANLLRDLTAQIKGRVRDPSQAVLRAGGVGGAGLRNAPKKLAPGVHAASAAEPDQPPPPAPKLAPIPDKGGRAGGASVSRAGAGVPPAGGAGVPPAGPSARLADELVRASGEEQGALLQKYQETRGVAYTEALAFAIGRLDGDAKRRARQALAQRLARLKADSLTRYLSDEEAEIRRAAALACAAKGLRDRVPLLIPLLADREALVARAAEAALKELTGQDLGPEPRPWQDWWDKHGKD